MKFKKYTLPSITNLDIAIKELQTLKRGSNYDPFDRKTGIEYLHKEVSKFLFNAVEKKDFETIKNILTIKDLINKKELVNKQGENIIEYLLKTSNNKLFLTTYNECKDYISYYLQNIQNLFSIVLTTKNFEMMEFMLKDKEFYNELKIESIGNAFFIAISENKDGITSYISNNFDVLDPRNVEATMIFCVANQKLDELKLIMSQNSIIKKFTIQNIEKMVAYSVLNKNVDAIKIMLENEYFSNLLSSADPNMQKSVLNILSGALLE